MQKIKLDLLIHHKHTNVMKKFGRNNLNNLQLLLNLNFMKKIHNIEATFLKLKSSFNNLKIKN